MRFFHLSDLHIGKQLHNYNLREDQEHILAEVIQYAKELRPDAIVIAGDIYDKSVPSGEAVTVFDEFLTELSLLEPKIPVLMIAGNHDSAQRLDYASRILGAQQIYIAGNAPETLDDYLKRVTLEDGYGPVHFYLLPFLKPGFVRGVFGGEVPVSYQEAVEKLLERETKCGKDRQALDWQERNVLVTHQFYTGSGQEAQTCDSEIFSVGGLDRIDSSVIEKFDYAALGHLHGAQAAGAEQIRYCGTLLKYSVSEANQKKCLHVVTLGEKGAPVQVKTYPLHPLRDVRQIRGKLEEILSAAKPEEKEDYVSVTLTDEVDPYRPKEQLERVYSHILEVRIDNQRTRRLLNEIDHEATFADPLSVFAEFYKEIQGKELSEEETKIMEKIIEQGEELEV